MSPADTPSPQVPDHELLARAGGGDRAALAALVRRHQANVLTLAYRFLGCWATAEDVTQEAFVRVWRGAAAFRPDAQFTTWLYRLVANLCWDRRRQAARESRRNVGAALQPPAIVASPADRADADERAARVRQAVAALPDRQRLAVILHRYEGMSHNDIAEVTGWTKSAVESCLVRAYENLRKTLSGMELR